MEELLPLAIQTIGEVAKLIEDAKTASTENAAAAKAQLEAALRTLQSARTTMRQQVAAEDAKVDAELAGK
jgi:DNA-binding protein H-NS